MYLVDGSLIDEEYFYTLEPQTTLVLQKPGEKLLSGKCTKTKKTQQIFKNPEILFDQLDYFNLPQRIETLVKL